jgi:hypothetical protein
MRAALSTKAFVRNFFGLQTGNSQANVDIVIEIEDLEHLENIINGVRKIPACMMCGDRRRVRETGCRQNRNI